MKDKREIKKTIEDYKIERDSQNFSRSTRHRYNYKIRELEWVLDEE